MIVWCDGAHDVVENMGRDRRLLERMEVSRPGATPVLRLFRFDPPGITLGHAQRPEEALDLERCRVDGVAWAVRPTGGRAIFHAAEWTYSLTARLDDPRWGGSLHQAYGAMSRLIVAALVRLGVPALLAASEHRGVEDGGACFASTARHEIVRDGKKLVGSAQRRGARALLQQGSVLLGPGHERLADYVRVSADRRGEVRSVLAAAATAGPELDRSTPLERWAEELVALAGPGARHIRGAAGAHLLTLPEAGSYTPMMAFTK